MLGAGAAAVFTPSEVAGAPGAACVTLPMTPDAARAAEAVFTAEAGCCASWCGAEAEAGVGVCCALAAGFCSVISVADDSLAVASAVAES